MPSTRRDFGAAVAAVAAGAVLPASSFAQGYPDRSVRVVMPFAPGGITDILARLVAKGLSDGLGQAFVVDNRPGANGTLGTQSVINSAPDGYTLLFSPASTHTVTPLVTKTTYDPVADLAPIGTVASTPLILLVNPQVPARNTAELVAWLKAGKGQASYGSYGTASASHLAGELFKQQAGVAMTHIAYKGGAPAQMDLIGGQIALMFSDVSGMQHVRNGRLRAIALTSLKPSASFPGLPTVAETLPGFEVGGWFALYAPRGTPKAVVDRVAGELQKVVSAEAFRARLAESGLDPFSISAESVQALTRAERQKWTKLIADANIKLEQ
ncbi:MAG: tripartite tricarboxylate transporter substrate binding protein [Burkholderiaceae bacterium]|nr:tripartite tricarboxylate transporter substrate binding protein [Burkholderiaceae bacterium]